MTVTAGGNPYGISLFTVQTPSQGDLHLQTQEEAAWYEHQRDRYLQDNHFPNASDIQDLERVLLLEVMIYRWGLWMAQGFDYMATRIDEGQMRQYIKDYSAETRLIKASLGIDKATRDKEKGESLSDYTANLLERAKSFGYFRNKQYEKSVTILHTLHSMLKTMDRCDEEERRLLDLSEEKIVAWVREVALKEWDDIEASYRKTQAIWIKSQ